MADKVVIELTKDELETVRVALCILSSKYVKQGDRAEAENVWNVRGKFLDVMSIDSCIRDLEAYQRNIAMYAEAYIDRARRLDELVKQFQDGKEG